VAVTAVLILSACGLGAGPNALLVLEWSGYEAEDFWTDFKQAYPDVTVNFEIGASDADIYAKMAAGDQADLFHPYTGWLQFYVDEGMVAEIDTTRLANWDQVPDYFKAVGQLNGKQYFVPFDWGFTSILYRTDKVDPEDATSWDLFWNPKYKGKISMWDGGSTPLRIAGLLIGAEDIDRETFERSMNIIVKHRSDIDLVAERVAVKLEGAASGAASPGSAGAGSASPGGPGAAEGSS
jgi:spermidine/putrescine-binding protein